MPDRTPMQTTASAGGEPGVRAGRVCIGAVLPEQVPYRLQVHRRLARELDGVEVHSAILRSQSVQAWEFDPNDDTHPTYLDQGLPRGGGPFRRIRREVVLNARLRKWFERVRPDIVLMNGYASLAQVRAIQRCRRQGIPCYFASDSNIKSDHTRGLVHLVKHALVGHVFRRCTGFLTRGRSNTCYHVHYDADQRTIVPFAYEPDYAIIRSITDDDLQQAAEAEGLSRDRRRIVFSGRMVRAKGVDTLIDAFARIAEERPDWDLLLIGSGVMEETLRGRVPSDVAGRVHWTGFVADAHRLAALMRLGEVFVLPSRSEPWGIVLNEATAAGMAVVSTNMVGAADDLVEDRHNGRLVPADRPDSLAEALLEITSGDRAAEMGRRSLEVLDRYCRRSDPVRTMRTLLAEHGLAADATGQHSGTA